MALTSQSARLGGSFGAYSTNRGRRRRRRGARRLLGFLLATGLISALVWWAWPGEGAPPPAPTAPPAGSPGDDAAPIAFESGEETDADATDSVKAPLTSADRPEPNGAADEQPRSFSAPLPEPRETVAATRERSATVDPANVLTMGAPEAGQAEAPRARNEESRTISGGPYSSPGGVQDFLREAAALAERNRPLHARTLYNRALHDPRISERDKRVARERIAALNETLVFSPVVIDGDPIAEKYEIQPGDVLSRIARKQAVNVDWRFLQRINGLSDPNKIRVGQTIKLVRGPFHAVVDKSDFRMDIYAGAPPMPPFTTEGYHGELPTYITSFPVGLGEYGSTPTGRWIVRTSSKVENPAWTNPRTNEFFRADDPENPIGEFWVGLEGVDENTSGESGYGIHGTIDPDSIGEELSMGCIRLRDDDVALGFEMLNEGVSTVWIVE